MVDNELQKSMKCIYALTKNLHHFNQVLSILLGIVGRFGKQHLMLLEGEPQLIILQMFKYLLQHLDVCGNGEGTLYLLLG